ncbi:MAG: DNA recombination protein RmuC [Spirochaetaceae bacterium]|nr:DNA recombination protein RmuC [Spirochaetaceae bacterium]
MEYLIVALLAFTVVLLLVVLMRKAGSGRDGAVLAAQIEAVSRESSRTRKELLEMLEQYRQSEELSLRDLKSRLDLSSGQSRKELLGMMEQYRQSVGQLEKQVASSLEHIRSDNEKRFFSLQQSVDMRLKSSLSTSFSAVSAQLNKVYEGLGQVKELTSGVDDLKRLMGNIKTRGTMGEVQAKNILDDILAPSQYEENVECKPQSGQRVEFAVRLPGTGSDVVYLPIDCKFPKEDFERILNAQEAGDREALQLARRALEVRVKGEAKDISVKYLDPPHTTAFGIMFLPSEGLYAEVIRIPGIVDDLQRTYKVVVSGPTTLAAILNSLQMGFRTLAIQKRSEEVWKVLSAVRTEFGRFGEELDTAQKRIGLVARSFDEVSKRTRMMDRKLSSVEMMEGDKAAVMLQDSV